ncbi:MAG: GDSL-type esterase/lipase family protein [Acidobacteriota bacterium]|nr:GDSL-type esterase/lipase family protein [Acidobacteriota bacterium]
MMAELRRVSKPAGSGNRKSVSAGTNRSRTIPIVIGAIALLIMAGWFLRPSPYSRVTNLESGGSSVIAFGDSLTSGYGASAGEDYPSRLSTLSGIPIVNAGRSGDTTSSALSRIESDVLSGNPRLVIVGLGGNDFLGGTNIKTTEANLRTIVREIQGVGAMVVLLGFQFPSLTASYEKMYQRVASEEGCLLIDGTLKGILTDPALRSDQIHPNARGYELMAERMVKPFAALLRKADAKRGG